MDGKSFLRLLLGTRMAWRDEVYYEYYWERNFPQTPTVHGVRGKRYKYIHYHGIWDIDELYDLQNDPYQLENLVTAEQPALVEELAGRLAELAACSGESCRAIEDEPFAYAAGASAPPQIASPRPAAVSEPLITYLGYATEDNMQWIEAFDVDVLSRGFLLFLIVSARKKLVQHLR